MAKIIEFTPVLEAAILASGDVMMAVQEIAGVFKAGQSNKLISVQVIDTDDQGQSFDLYFFNASATLGTLNAAITINDTDAAKSIGQVSFTAAANGTDMINSWNFVKFLDEGIVMKPLDTSSSLWIGAVCRGGTPTYTASGFKIKLGFAD